MDLFENHFSRINGNLYYDPDNDTYEMFSNKGIQKHINYNTFKQLFKHMNGRRDLNIVETGMAAYGTNSTYLFNEYVKKYGGRFWSVDINPELENKHKGNMCPATQLVTGDSVTFLKDWVSKNSTADVIYLDSYDLDFYNPDPSGKHGLEEYKAILPAIKKDTLLLIDDTPINPYWTDSRGVVYYDMVNFYDKNKYMPGKGMYVLNEVKNAEKIIHNYQVLYKFYDSPSK